MVDCSRSESGWHVPTRNDQRTGKLAPRQDARNNAEKLLLGDDIFGGAAWMRVARAVDVLLENEWTGKVH